MRASRLLNILMTLQARGRVTAQSLADECEVSLRTIYRDMDELSAAGIPLYSDRGPEGGYRLLDGYRTRLNGLSAQEAEALFLTGLPGPAADLGLGAVIAAAQMKLMAALPPELRAGAERMRARFHLDAPGWFGEADQPRLLLLVAKAVWEERPIQMRYRSWREEKWRRAGPLGIVLKSGTWYLVAEGETGIRTHRISRILDVKVLDGHYKPPPGFDLAACWRETIQRFGEESHTGRATLRVSPWGLKMLETFSYPYIRAGMEVSGEADGDGWRVVSLPIGELCHAASDFLRLGQDAEVLEPPELRAKMADVAAVLHRRYAENGDRAL